MKTRNLVEMHAILREKVCYEKLVDYESRLSQIKFPLVQVFRGLHELNFLEIYIYVNKSIFTDV